jgi:LmbE family N-acetylglucosaminyl deacetylase
MLGVNIVFNHADYRLMSKAALEALGEYRETNLFLRGIIPQLGFKTEIVEYARKERLAGESKYTLKKMLKLAGKKGHQNALLCGLMTAKSHCDAAISMDADLQDDIDVVDKFIEAYKNGCGIVYGVRNDRTSDSFAKRFTAEGYYKILELLGVNIVFNHADYRLMSKAALEALGEYGETNLFLRGIIPELGFQTAIVEYARKERLAGESKYTLKKMLKLAWDGITSFSVRPLRMLSVMGALAVLVAVVMALYTLISHFTANTVSGWSSLMISIWFLGGLNLLALGIVGEYIGKIYGEVKARPRFIVEQTKGLK